MIRIAYVVGGLPFGGVENWLYDIAIRMKNYENYECKIFNVSGVGLKMPEFLSAGIDVVNIGKSKSSASSHRIDTALFLRNELQEYSPDIIHTMHHSGDYFGRISSIGMKKPVLTHIHNIKHEKKITRKVVNKALSYFTQGYISVSKAVESTVDSDHNFFDRKKYILYNGIDIKKYETEKYDLNSMYNLTGKIIVGVGRFVVQKNFESLIRALKILIDSKYDVSLVLVGEGGMRPTYESLVDNLQLSNKVILTGYRNDVGSYLRGASVLSMPSLYEGFPLVHLEAMYCRVPAVVSHVVPSLEVCAEASLVCDFSPESIASQISMLLDNPELHSKLVDAGRKIVNEYTIDRCMEKLFAIYSEVLKEARE